MEPKYAAFSALDGLTVSHARSLHEDLIVEFEREKPRVRKATPSTLEQKAEYCPHPNTGPKGSDADDEGRRVLTESR